MKLNIVLFTICASLAPMALAQADKPAAQQTPEIFKTVVPGGSVVKHEKNDYDIETPGKTIVEVELTKDGAIDEASGDASHNGDVFVPGDGRISLTEAVEALKKAGKTPTGDWSFEKKLTGGWVYEFDGTDKDQRMEYEVSAKDGKILSEKKDK